MSLYNVCNFSVVSCSLIRSYKVYYTPPNLKPVIFRCSPFAAEKEQKSCCGLSGWRTIYLLGRPSGDRRQYIYAPCLIIVGLTETFAVPPSCAIIDTFIVWYYCIHLRYLTVGTPWILPTWPTTAYKHRPLSAKAELVYCIFRGWYVNKYRPVFKCGYYIFRRRAELAKLRIGQRWQISSFTRSENRAKF